MRKVCAWCNKSLTPDEKISSEGAITHGICSLCAIKVTSFRPRSAKWLLDLLYEPVFLIDSAGTVLTANKSGQKMLGKELEEIENHLGGDAFECSYAKTEGGCGGTIHCKTCAIRNTVMDTLSSGKGVQNVPAFQSIDTRDGTSIMKFNISTEKIGEHILLRIDNASEYK